MHTRIATDLQRHRSWEAIPPMRTLPATAGFEWLELVNLWKDGYEGPIWFLADPRRTDLRQIDPQQPVSNVRMLSEIVNEVTLARSVQVRVLGAFALVAFLLAASGIHGLLAFGVSQRQREIGVRMALGARARDVLLMVVGNGMKLALIGLVIGLAGAWGLSRFIQGLLFGVQPTDLLTFGIVSICLMVAALLAALFASF
jgi:ABC-type antimicrobial peptide transport system permease subunit